MLPILAWLPVAALLLGHGWDGALRRDDANLMHAGQQAARGTPPYHSIFNMTGPVSPLIAGAVVLLARALGTDELPTTRFLFGGLARSATALLCGLARRLGLGAVAATAGMWVMATYPTFARSALNGPKKKTAMVLFVAAALLAYHRRRWFLAGSAATLALLSRQGAFVLLVALLVGATGTGSGALFRLVAGRAQRFFPSPGISCSRTPSSDRVAEIAAPPAAVRIPIEVLKYTPDVLEFRVECPSTGWLWVTDWWSAGWRAMVNGKAVEAWGGTSSSGPCRSQPGATTFAPSTIRSAPPSPPPSGG